MSFYQVNRPSKLSRRRAPEFDPKNPRAIAICDGCGFLVQHDELREQKDYRGGSTPVGLGIWVCGTCLDRPQPYYKKQVLPPDPVPVDKPRPDTASGPGSYTTYASVADLPAAATVPAGYPVDVTISGETVRCYADDINWRRWDTNEVVS